MPIDKQGNYLTWKQFFHKWGEGIEGITMEQKLKVQIRGVQVMIIGILMGLFISLYGWKKLWWVALILVGALINTVVQYIGLWQQNVMFKKINEQMKGGEEIR